MADLLDPFAEVGAASPAAPPLTTRLFDALRDAEEAANVLRTDNKPTELSRTLHQIGRLHLTLGDGSSAVRVLSEAAQLGAPSAPLRISLGQALCFTGQYASAKAELDRVLVDLPPSADRLRGMYLLVEGSVYKRDQNLLDEAGSCLTQALPLLEAGKLDYLMIGCLLALAELYLRKRQFSELSALLKQADDQMTASKITWYRPEWWLLSARAALEQSDCRGAIKLAGKGLAAVDDRGDMRALPGLYRTLATALERLHERIEDARDARNRSVIAARARASRLELARSLFEQGQHYKLFTNRPTLRARGMGYLYEANQLFRQMGIASPR